MYTRGTGGALTLAQTVPTGQNGTGASLQAQGALLIVSHYLLAVNAGSNSISVLNVGGPSVKLISTVNSGGTSPKSLTAHADTVYVMNAGGAGSISGFTFNTTTGILTPIAGSTQPMSGMPNPQPAQIGFTSNGLSLVVTEKTNNVLDVYPVNASGVAGPPTVYPSNAATPYGFASGKNSHLYVTEAVGTVSLGSSVSSYAMSSHHVPEIISASVPTEQSAACWAILNLANTFLYVTDNESQTISIFSVDSTGHLTLDPSFNVTTPADPFDIAMSPDGLNAYVLFVTEIVPYTINSNGSLTAGTGAPMSSNVASGLVVR